MSRLLKLVYIFAVAVFAILAVHFAAIVVNSVAPGSEVARTLNYIDIIRIISSTNIEVL